MGEERSVGDLLLGGGLAELEALLPLAHRDQEVVPLVKQIPHGLFQPQDQGALLGDLLPCLGGSEMSGHVWGREVEPLNTLLAFLCLDFGVQDFCASAN